MSEYILPNRHLRDLNLILFGESQCEPSHKYGPESRSYVLIHFVVSGCGTFIREGETHTAKAGEAFIVVPDEIITYCADQNDPWHYMWIAFDGALSDRFRSLPHVLKYSTNWAEEILLLDRESSMLAYNAASKLFLMYSEWFEGNTVKRDYVKSVKDYINAKYTQHLTVEGIAEQMSLDRRYLSRIFKQKTGKSIQEYLIFVRLEKAKALLKDGYHIAEASQMCGYDDTCNFSKMFKKHTGVSPGCWKNRTVS